MPEPISTAPVDAREVAIREPRSNYPEPFFSRMQKREKRALGDVFGITSFGVNLTTLAPGGESALLHRHTSQQELVLVLEGHPTLVTDTERTAMGPWMCVGFRPDGGAHHLVNETDAPVVYVEVGDRLPGDEGIYPEDDLAAAQDANGRWVFTRRDGTPY